MDFDTTTTYIVYMLRLTVSQHQNAPLNLPITALIPAISTANLIVAGYISSPLLPEHQFAIHTVAVTCICHDRVDARAELRLDFFIVKNTNWWTVRANLHAFAEIFVRI